MFSFIYKVVTGTKSLVQVIMKLTSTMLLRYCINIQSFVNDKSSSTLQLIKGKLRYLKKLPRYLSGTVNSTFKSDTRGSADQSVSPAFPGGGDRGELWSTPSISSL